MKHIVLVQFLTFYRVKNNDMQFPEMMDSILPFGDRTGNLLIGRTPDGNRRVINISPGARGGAGRQPGSTREYRKVPGIFIYKNRQK